MSRTGNLPFLGESLKRDIWFRRPERRGIKGGFRREWGNKKNDQSKGGGKKPREKSPNSTEEGRSIRVGQLHL